MTLGPIFEKKRGSLFYIPTLQCQQRNYGGHLGSVVFKQYISQVLCTRYVNIIIKHISKSENAIVLYAIGYLATVKSNEDSKSLVSKLVTFHFL